jgi:lysyl-tRNA synthetase class 2
VPRINEDSLLRSSVRALWRFFRLSQNDMHERLLAIAKERETLCDLVRGFFRLRGYLEVETPIIVQSPGMEPNLSPFETEVVEPNGKRHAAGLMTSPEYAMKKLLGSGCEKIFTLTKVFRNHEELGGSHNPEFTMLEWYQQGADYHACMDETEALVKTALKAFPNFFKERRGVVTVEKPFRRVCVRDLFLEHVGIDLDVASVGELRASCHSHQIHTDPSDTESDLFYRLFLSLVEPCLGTDSMFVYDYPKRQAALSRLTKDGKYGERFELYIDGLELCNGFTELTNADEQRRRFKEEAQERQEAGKTVFPIDEELLRLLPSVRQPTFGNAFGIDRLHMIVTGKRFIADVLLFPASEIFERR